MLGRQACKMPVSTQILYFASKHTHTCAYIIYRVANA